MLFLSMKTWSILFIITIVVLVKEDVRKNGTLEDSNTGIFLQDAGVYKHVFVFYSWADRFVTQTKATIRSSYPDYYDNTAEILEPAVATIYSYANATVFSAKKWCYIVTHQRTREYLPTVKDNILHYHQEFKNSIQYIKEFVPWFIHDSATSRIIKEKIELIWHPVKTFIEDTFSITIDLDKIFAEIKATLQTVLNYVRDLYEQVVDKLNLERTI